MNRGPSFEILFRKKIPYWSELLMGVMVALFIFLFLLSLFMIPSKDVSDEMKVAYYILVVPEWLKEASTYSFLGLIVVIPLYSVSRSYNPAILEIQKEEIIITGAKMDRVLPINSVKRITLNDVRHLIRRPKE